MYLGNRWIVSSLRYSRVLNYISVSGDMNSPVRFACCNHPLHKIFNRRRTLKLSYSCMPNMKSVISSHNKYVLSNFNSPTQQPDTCNCRKKPDCPLEGKCLQSNVIYQATVTATTTETYVGRATNFKER